MAIPDPTEEIKAIRHRMGADFGFDLDRIFADIQRRQLESGRSYVTRPSRRVANNNARKRSGDGEVSDKSESTPTVR